MVVPSDLTLIELFVVFVLVVHRVENRASRTQGSGDSLISGRRIKNGSDVHCKAAVLVDDEWIDVNFLDLQIDYHS